MLNPVVRGASVWLAPGLASQPRYSFGLGTAIVTYVRTLMNRVRWEENREFTAIQNKNTQVPKNIEQATKLFIAGQQEMSLSEKERMQRIDNVLAPAGRSWGHGRTTRTSVPTTSGWTPTTSWRSRS